jgi:hypothetical protein
MLGQRADIDAAPDEGWVHDERDSRRDRDRCAFPREQQELDGRRLRGRITSLLSVATPAFVNSDSRIGIRSAAARRRNESFRDEVAGPAARQPQKSPADWR